MVGHRAMEMAIEKARATGVGLVGVSNSRHYGSAGYYAEMALPHDMIGISMTQASPAVLPTFGAKRKIGTNAMSYAIPAGEEPAYVLDMATSAVAVGKLELARRKSEPIPVGWAVDSEGRDTTDPNDYWNGGALVPLGSMPELSSYKDSGWGCWWTFFPGADGGGVRGDDVSGETGGGALFRCVSGGRFPSCRGVQVHDGRDDSRHEVDATGPV